MADFTSRIIAQLDRSQFDAEMSAIRNSKYTVKLTLDAGVQQQIDSIKSSIGQIGNTKINLGANVDTRAFRSTISALSNQGKIAVQDLQRALAGMNFDSASIEKITRQMNNLDIAISKVTTTMGAKGLTFTINGYDQLGRTIKLVELLDQETGAFIERSRQLGQYFAQPMQADGITNYTAQFKEMMSLLQQANALEVRIKGLDDHANANQVQELTSQLEALRAEFDQLSSKNLANFSPDQINAFANAAEKAKDKIAEIEARAKDMRANMAGNIMANVDNGSITAQISTVTAQFDKLSSTGHSSLSQLGADIQQLSSLQSTLSSTSKGDIDSIISTYNQYQETLTRVRNTIATISAETSNVQGFKDLVSVLNQINSLEIRIKGLDSSTNANQVMELTNQLQNLIGKYKELYANVSPKLTPGQSDALSASVDATIGKLNELDAKIQDSRAKIAEAFATRMDSGGISADIASIAAEYEKFKFSGHSSIAQVEADLNELRSIQTQLGSTSRSDVDGMISLWDRYQKALERAKNSMKTVKADVGSTVNTTQISGLDNKIATWAQKNSRALKQFGGTIDEIRQKLAQMAQAGGGSKSEFNALATQFNQVQAAASNAGILGKTWGDQFKGTLSGITRYFSGYYLIFQTIRALKDMYAAIKDIDTAMVQLRRVTNETTTTYNAFLNGASDIAKSIGTTISDYVNSVADFARSGFGFEDAQKMAQAANVYAMVGNISTVEAATTSLTSTLKAFNISGEDALSVVDKFDNIGNKFAITSEGVGEALMRSASSLAAAGNTIDQSIAIVTAANTVVQNPESVGNALKTNHCLYVQKCA